MRTVEEALAAVEAAAGAPRLVPETVALEEAAGRVLAGDVALGEDAPAFRRSAMDGVAVRRDDAVAGRRLAVAGRVVAGERADVRLAPGACVRVMTGAPVPEGTALVVPVEWTTGDDVRGVTLDRLPTGTNVVEAGTHHRAGEVVLPRGLRLDAADVGALAAAGVARVQVAARPAVAVLPTGTELVAPGTRPGPAQVRESNGPMLRAGVRAAGGVPRALPAVGDEPGALAAAVRRGLEADLLVLSGGVSKGELDLVPDTLEAEGVRCVFHGWAVQPGGPLWFGTRGPTLVCALPGNPLASLVGFEVLAVPALRTRLGLPFAPRRTLPARMPWPGGAAAVRRRYRPVRLAGDAAGTLCAEPLAWRGSGDAFGAVAADGLAVLPEGRAEPAGTPVVVDVLPLGALGARW
jgi:molybdopterin molybdotransferase